MALWEDAVCYVCKHVRFIPIAVGIRELGGGGEGSLVNINLPPNGKYNTDIFHLLFVLLIHRISQNFCSEYKSVLSVNTEFFALPSSSIVEFSLF